MTTVSAPRIDISSLGQGQQLGRGGQGRVTAVSGTLIKGQWPAVLKTYAHDVVGSLNAAALETVVGFPGTLGAKDRDWLDEKSAWPALIAEDRGMVCGFLMRVVPPTYYFDFRTQTQGTLQKPAEMAFLLNSDRYVSGSGLSVSDRDRLLLLEDLAGALARLHSLGVVVGDLSPKNLLFSFNGAPRCFIIDCDAMLVRGRTVLPQVQTPDWEVPSAEPMATPASDAFKFGLLAIRLFARDQSSHDPIPVAMLSAELGRLAAASQHPDPSQRPGPGAWIPALAAAARALPSKRVSGSAVTTWPPQPVPVPAAAPVKAAPSQYRSPPVRSPRRPVRHATGKIVGTTAAIALVVLVTMVGLHAAGHASEGTAVPAGQSSSAEEAAQVNSLLDSSTASRESLTAAVQEVDDCTDVSAAVSAISGVASQRASEYSRAAALGTAALPDGAELKTDLASALHYSMLADNAFLSWAEEQENTGCGNSVAATNAYRAGMTASAGAVAAKQAFVQLWNPIASGHGYPDRSQADV